MISIILGALLIIAASLGIAYFEGWFPFRQKTEVDPKPKDTIDPVSVAEGLLIEKEAERQRHIDSLQRQARMMEAATSYIDNNCEKLRSLGLEFQNDGINRIVAQRVKDATVKCALIFNLDRFEIIVGYKVDEVRYADDMSDTQTGLFGLSLLIKWVLQ